MATPKPAPKPAPAPGKPAAASANEDGAPPPKKKSKLVLIVVLALVLLLLAGGGGAAWYFLAGPGATPAAAEKGKDAAKAGSKEKEKDKHPPVFANLEPFTVNLAPEAGDRYLQTAIVLQMSDDKAADAVKQYMPVLRNRILMLLSSKKPSELESIDGKQKLVAELVAATRESIPGSTPEHGVTGALFSSFVIQ